MSIASPNFGFLAAHDELLVEYAVRAEHYVFTDPNAALVKLRQFIETLSALAAAEAGVRLLPNATLADTLRALRHADVFDARLAGLFRTVQQQGNRAAHDHLASQKAALDALKAARICAVWFHRAFGSDPGFKAGAFVPPKQPVDASAMLQRELEALRRELAESKRAAEVASESAEQAAAREAAALEEIERAHADVEAAFALAAETEAQLEAQREALSSRLVERTEQVATSSELQADAQKRGRDAALDMDLTEAETRLVIDAQLRAAGWDADSVQLRYAAGVRPQKGRNVAIAEWPTESGPADYVLFHGLTPLAVVEAKRAAVNVAGVIDQAERYSRDFTATDGVTPAGPWGAFRVPFVFATNGRPYLKQLELQSGVHMRDVRVAGNRSRAVDGWYAPDDLAAELAKPPEATEAKPVDEHLPGVLRPYQREAVAAIEDAIANGQRTLLLAMATGTGKTRTAIALAYRLIQSRRFRRVLFLVDRSALGEQTENAFQDLKLEQHQSFAEIYEVMGLGDQVPEPETRLHIATVQGMVRRILYPADDAEPVPVSWYDCVLIDECHRGYNLDRELSDTEFTFRDEADYISKYRRVVEHFDAVRIGLTATPAKHTTEIFGRPVFQYGYRRAVVEGYLCDHEPPIRIVTKLARDGIRFEAGSEVTVYEPRSGQLDLFETPDDVEFEVAEFNRTVLTENFNRAVCEELARRIDPALPGKTLVFCATDAHADLVVKLLTDAFQHKYGAEHVPASTVQKITGASDRPLQRIREFKNEVLPNVAVTVDLLTTGMDVPKIWNLVFLRRVRSRILYEQMVGRATRKCDEIEKPYFCIYDAVDLYDALHEVSDMQAVVTQPKVTVQQLADELVELVTGPQTPVAPKAAAQVQEQLAAKLQRKRRALERDANLEEFRTLAAGTEPDAFFALLTDGAPAEVVAMLTAHPGLVGWLDRLRGMERPPVFVSGHLDDVVEVSSGYGKGRTRPEDYLDAFRAYLETHRNELPALMAVMQRPRELTRAELRALRLTLDEAGFSEASLRNAYRDTTNQEVAAGIVGYIRQAALGDPLVPYEERVRRALADLLASRPWTDPQRQWLARIGKQLVQEVVVDRDALNGGQFRAHGGFDRINKVFDGQLEAVLGELADGIWPTSA